MRNNSYTQHRVCAMAGKVLKPKSLHLTNFVPNRKVSASISATDTYTRTVMGKATRPTVQL